MEGDNVRRDAILADDVCVPVCVYFGEGQFTWRGMLFCEVFEDGGDYFAWAAPVGLLVAVLMVGLGG